jgi:hypothetical protein
MNLKDILSISGYSGLFRYISQGRNGVIVEGLTDNKRMNANSALRISALEDIAIFTDEKEIPLKEVLQKIFQKENGGQALDSKLTNEKIKSYFESILPDYDRDKVYVSDMKKVIMWYNILQSLNLVDMEEDVKEEGSEETTPNKEA